MILFYAKKTTQTPHIWGFLHQMVKLVQLLEIVDQQYLISKILDFFVWSMFVILFKSGHFIISRQTHKTKITRPVSWTWKWSQQTHTWRRTLMLQFTWLKHWIVRLRAMIFLWHRTYKGKMVPSLSLYLKLLYTVVIMLCSNCFHIYSGHHVLLIICPKHGRGFILDSYKWEKERTKEDYYLVKHVER